MGPTALIIDDSRAIRRIIRTTLANARIFENFVEAGDGHEGMERAAAAPVDLVLCDLEMPNADGFAFLRAFRAESRFETTPVLMLSGNNASDKKVEGFALGANDYIVKPCDPAELCARARSYLRLKILQDQLQEKNAELSRKNDALAQMAITDPLTGLHNRRYFMERAGDELKRAQRHHRELAILILDVDHFKRINDTFGHPQGDDVLVAIANTLRSTLRATDVLARFGGEEFVVCLPETAAHDARIVAEKLRVAIERTVVAGMDRPVTMSIGVGAYPSPAVHTVDAILRLADEALYRAKGSGRNRVELASAAPFQAA